ncbi:unnamed protein product [Symbiodinium sp. CCMP2456]|nr:unnamed protein product [Symbiodinium sp. CCMP2456]
MTCGASLSRNTPCLRAIDASPLAPVLRQLFFLKAFCFPSSASPSSCTAECHSAHAQFARFGAFCAVCTETMLLGAGNGVLPSAFLDCKLLQETASASEGAFQAIRAAQAATQRLGHHWPLMPAEQAYGLPASDDDFDAESSGLADEVLTEVIFVLLAPDYRPETIRITLLIPQGLGDALDLVETCRCGDLREAFPLMAPAWPQPDPRRGVLILCPAWLADEVVICVDLTMHDGRLFAIRAPSRLGRHDLLAISGLASLADIDVYVPGTLRPLNDADIIFLATGHCVRYLPRGAEPPLGYSLEGMLCSHLPWATDPPFPVDEDVACYCVVAEEGVRNFRLHPSRAVRIVLMLPLSSKSILFRLMLLALGDTVKLSLPLARPLLRGWRRFSVRDGWVDLFGLLDRFSWLAPPGWSVGVSGCLLGQQWLWISSGQVLELCLTHDPGPSPAGDEEETEAVTTHQSLVLVCGISRALLANMTYHGLCMSFCMVALLDATSWGFAEAVQLPQICEHNAVGLMGQVAASRLSPRIFDEADEDWFEAFFLAATLAEALFEHFGMPQHYARRREVPTTLALSSLIGEPRFLILKRVSACAVGRAPAPDELVVITTDGSFDPCTRHAGWGVVISLASSNDLLLPGQFIGCCGSFLGAVLALRLPGFLHGVFRADNIGALQGAEGTVRMQDHPLCHAAAALHTALRLLQTSPTYQHVPGHSADPANELADALAGQASKGVGLGASLAFNDLRSWFADDGAAFAWLPRACFARQAPRAVPDLHGGLMAWSRHTATASMTPSDTLSPFLRAFDTAGRGPSVSAAPAVVINIVSFNLLSLLDPGGPAHVAGLHGASGRVSLVSSSLAGLEALALPENRAVVESIISSAPCPDWTVDASEHVALLTDHLYRQLVAAFPKERRRMRIHCATEVLRIVVPCFAVPLLLGVLVHSLSMPFSLGGGFGAFKSGVRWIVSSFVATEYVEASPSADLHQAVRQIMRPKKYRGKGAAPLPMLKKADGTVCTSADEIATVWREHFRVLEAGQETDAETLAQTCRQRQLAFEGSDIVDAAAIPTWSRLQAAFKATAPHKACGPDLLLPILCSLFSQKLTEAFWPVMLKAVLRSNEAVGLKGGILHRIAKPSAVENTTAGYRGILVQSCLSKVLHRAARHLAVEHWQQHALPLQIGGKKGCPAAFGHFCSRAFLAVMRALGRSAAVLFVDIAAAYYGVVREAVLGASAHSQPLDALVASLGLTDADMQLLQHYIEHAPVLRQQGACALLQEVAEELHRNTWFVMAGDSCVIETCRGTRPGGSLADIIFNILFSKVLSRRCSSTLGPFVPRVPWSGCRSPWTKPGSLDRAPLVVEASDVVYADDLASFLVCDRADEITEAVSGVAADTIDTFLPHGLNANMGPTKTAAIVVPVGRGSRAVRRALFSQGKGRLVILPETRGGLRLDIEWDLFSGEIMSLYRQLLLFFTWNHGPDAAWALLAQYEEYKRALRGAAQWLLAAVGSTCGLGDIETNWQAWEALVRDSSHSWKTLLKRADSWHRMRTSQISVLDGFARASWPERVGSRPTPVENCVHACLPCRIAFTSRQQWGAHAHRAHGYHSRAHLVASGRTCQACGQVASERKLRTHLRLGLACVQRIEQLSACGPVHADASKTHELAPAIAGAGKRSLGAPATELCAPLLADLSVWQPPCCDRDEAIFAVVRRHMVPLPVLRSTLLAWRSTLADGPVKQACDDVLLVLHPEHLCDSVAGATLSEEPDDVYVPAVVVPRRWPAPDFSPLLCVGVPSSDWARAASVDGLPVAGVTLDELPAWSCAAVSGACVSFPSPPLEALPVFSPSPCTLRAIRSLCSWTKTMLDALSVLLQLAGRGLPVLARFPVSRHDMMPLSARLETATGAEEGRGAAAFCFTIEFNCVCLH